MKTKLLIEQHFHGCFGIDFNKASVDDILYLSKEILKYGIGGIFPTIVTDSIENTKRAIKNIKEASQKQTSDMAKILGIHLEGIFINPEKKGIHNPKHFLAPTIENYKLIEDDFIKIVTLAPELDDGLIKYLQEKNIKIQAGHCTGGDLTGCSGVTHLFNAMSGITHRGKSTALSALINDNIYTEIIADGIHVSDEALKLLFKTKSIDKIILVSDCLPCTESDLKEFIFADETIYYDGEKATSKEGTLAGSTTLLPDIIKRLAGKLEGWKCGGQEGISEGWKCGGQEVKQVKESSLSGISQEQQTENNPSTLQPFNLSTSIEQLITNPYTYHNIDLKGSIEWAEDWNIVKVTV